MSDALKKPLSVVESAEADAPAQFDHTVDMKYLVRALLKYNASDLHIKAGRPPLYRINGKLIPAKMPKFAPEQIKDILYAILNERQREDLENKKFVDLSFRMGNYGRFRCNVFYQKGTLSSVVRLIPIAIPSFEELNLPSVLKEFCKRPRGLVLVTGATGSGKSTTLAAMVQHINETQHKHILMLEDPIEFVFRDLKSSITQREVGLDTHTFRDGLYEGLRQDPDVIVIGEMRDPEIIRTALTAAETGHLVISTMHTKGIQTTLERILEVFPGDTRNQVRIELASTLVGIVTQHLLVKADGEGRVPAFEVLVHSPAIEDLIMKNELDRLNDVVSSSSDYYKMQTLNQALEELVRKGQVRMEEAMKLSSNPADLQLRLDGIDHGANYEATPDEKTGTGISRF